MLLCLLYFRLVVLVKYRPKSIVLLVMSVGCPIAQSSSDRKQHFFVQSHLSVLFLIFIYFCSSIVKTNVQNSWENVFFSDACHL